MFHFDWEKETLKVGFRGDNGEYMSIGFEGPGTKGFMISLNKTNNAVKSLHRRVMEKVVTDGKLIGTISGTPD